MKSSEKASIKYALKQKYEKGTIGKDEYQQLLDQLDTLAANGATQQYAKSMLGFKTKSSSGKSSAPPANAQAGVDPKVQEKVEKQLQKVYKEAKKDVQEKLKQFLDKFKSKDAQKKAMLASGQITKDEYDQWKKGQVFVGDIWKKKLEQISGTLAHSNEVALGIVNDEKVSVFAEGANFQSYQLTQDTGMNLSFAIYDKTAVERLIKKQPELMPRKVINGKKEKAWQQKKIANAVSQSIIQGESLDEAAERIARDTVSQNGSNMIRYAGTALTAAQNAGRMETLERASQMGIKCKKRWLATLDSRTRDSHAELDGQVVDIDKPFITHNRDGSLSEIMYPGDPQADGEQVWNCRCTLVYEYEEYPSDPEFDQRRDNVTGEVIQNMPYEEWKAAKENNELNDLNLAKVELAKAQKEVVAAKIDEGHAFSGIWKEDVTLSDYAAKKASIQAKRDYYISEIDKIKQAQSSGQSWATDEKLKQKEDLLRELNKFEKQGQLLEAREKALAKVQGIYGNIGIQKNAQVPQISSPAQPISQPPAKKGQFDPDAWDAKKKRDAAAYKTKEEADSALRPKLDKQWEQLTEREKYAVWEYTHNSHPMNRPLSGYDDSWERYGFVGLGKTSWSHEDNYDNRNLRNCGEMKKFGRPNGQPMYQRAISDLTKAIEKAETDQDMFLIRGSSESGLAGMFEGAGMDFSQIMELLDGSHSQKEIDDALVGQLARNHAFTSTGIAKGTGFDDTVSYRIFMPKGTKAIYAEPQSHYGQSAGGQDRIYTPGSGSYAVGSEAEMILQRGTTYRVTAVKQKITKDWRGRDKAEYEVEMEVVEQPDYFVHGDEHTFDGGKTREPKSS